MAEEVRRYLALEPRQLPSRWFYDALGSALFDAICELPWYRITRAELGLLRRHGAEILAAVEPLAEIVELGSGNGSKLAALVAARRGAAKPLRLHLVDISNAALETASGVLSAFDGVDVVAHHAPYEVGLGEVRHGRSRGRALTMFLGSNIGNFDPPAAAALLRRVRANLDDDDGFLVGADLVKPEAELQRAYDDPLGVTAAFNRNLLVRLNREIGADFDVAAFAHRAVWNAAASRVEMHLVSTRVQDVHVAGLTVRFREGEPIWTESSYKYRPEGIVAMLAGAGLRVREQWIDGEAGFALTLAAPRAGAQ